MKKKNFLGTESKRKQIKVKASNFKSPAKIKGKSFRPSRTQG